MKSDVKKWQNPARQPSFYALLSFIGAAVYWIQQANGFGEIVVAILKAAVWPAFMVYHLLGFLKM